jgi:UDP-N-acetylmuramoyl-tripeptide--D-alanyl-D-alanine ligase
MLLRTSDLATATGGALHGPDVQVSGAAIDSRLVRDGDLFIAVVAERDGHEYIDAAVERGALAALCARHQPQHATAIVVPDTAAALLDLGRFARGRLPDRVVGITGSVGKTTVKDLTAAALGASMRTAASEKSFNNELGVPLTLLNAPDDAEAVVVEMGARGRGHIARLCEVARPTIAIVTVVALAHAEMFGTLEAVAAAKGELVESLPSHGTAVLNADDALVSAMADLTGATVVRYGVEHTGADVRAEAVSIDDELRPSFRLRSPWGDVDVRLAMRGRHQVINALAAGAAALAAGVALEDVAAGLADAQPSPWRMSLTHTPKGALLLNDAYNANPTSMAAALDALAALPARRRIAVLGVMAELGPDSDLEHRRIATYAEDLGIDVLAVSAPEYERVTVADIDAAVQALGDLGDGDAVLVKGSRVAGLERLAERLCA